MLTCAIPMASRNKGLGLTFTSAGVTAPAPSQVRALPAGFKVSDTPVFTTRGLQPFHDFAEGPDWWCVHHKCVCVCMRARVYVRARARVRAYCIL